jgi:membrane protein implicated in regulation of membrane protease activity
MNLETLYWVLAIFGGAILIIRFILFMIGIGDGDTSTDFDSGMDVDIDVDHDFSGMDHGGMDSDHTAGGHDAGIMSYLSLQSISGFFLLFGLVGLATLQMGTSSLVSIIFAFGAGAFTAWTVTKILSSMRKLQSSGNQNIKNAIGLEGKVYLTIPENETGVVSLGLQGTLRNLDAISEDGTRLPTGTLVVVSKISAENVLVVRKINTN